MDPSLILQNVSKHITLEKGETEYFLSLLEHHIAKKNEWILREGEVCRYEFFVLKGCLKSYTIDEKGNEHIIQFAPEDWWAGDLYSFFSEKPSRYYIQTIEPSETLQITKPNLELLYQNVPKFERFFRIMLQNALISQFQRIDQNLSMNAEEKYLAFRNKYPQLENRLPQRMIAAFLGITPEFLSMTRKKLTKG